MALAQWRQRQGLDAGYGPAGPQQAFPRVGTEDASELVAEELSPGNEDDLFALDDAPTGFTEAAPDDGDDLDVMVHEDAPTSMNETAAPVPSHDEYGSEEATAIVDEAYSAQTPDPAAERQAVEQPRADSASGIPDEEEYEYEADSGLIMAAVPDVGEDTGLTAVGEMGAELEDDELAPPPSMDGVPSVDDGASMGDLTDFGTPADPEPEPLAPAPELHAEGDGEHTVVAPEPDDPDGAIDVDQIVEVDPWREDK